jgi:hypothetical protein
MSQVRLMQVVLAGACAWPAAAPPMTHLYLKAVSSCFAHSTAWSAEARLLQADLNQQTAVTNHVHAVSSVVDTCDPTITYHISHHGDSLRGRDQNGNLFAASHGACIASDHCDFCLAFEIVFFECTYRLTLGV